jgi:hypothetical protein
MVHMKCIYRVVGIGLTDRIEQYNGIEAPT